MKCKNCNTKLKKGETVCPNCGMQVVLKPAPLWLTIVLSVAGVGSVPLALFVSALFGFILNIAGIIVSKVMRSKIGFWVNIAALIITIVATIIIAVTKVL